VSVCVLSVMNAFILHLTGVMVSMCESQIFIKNANITEIEAYSDFTLCKCEK